VRLEGLGHLKKSNDLIGTRTRDLPVCSIVPQPTTLPRAYECTEENLLIVIPVWLFLKRIRVICMSRKVT
jgi:hypothetical protein